MCTSVQLLVESEKEGETGREGGMEGERGGREGGRERERERGREREGEREREREREREICVCYNYCVLCVYYVTIYLPYRCLSVSSLLVGVSTVSMVTGEEDFFLRLATGW